MLLILTRKTLKLLLLSVTILLLGHTSSTRREEVLTVEPDCWWCRYGAASLVVTAADSDARRAVGAECVPERESEDVLVALDAKHFQRAPRLDERLVSARVVWTANPLAHTKVRRFIDAMLTKKPRHRALEAADVRLIVLAQAYRCCPLLGCEIPRQVARQNEAHA